MTNEKAIALARAIAGDGDLALICPQYRQAALEALAGDQQAAVELQLADVFFISAEPLSRFAN